MYEYALFASLGDDVYHEPSTAQVSDLFPCSGVLNSYSVLSKHTLPKSLAKKQASSCLPGTHPFQQASTELNLARPSDIAFCQYHVKPDWLENPPDATSIHDSM